MSSLNQNIQTLNKLVYSQLNEIIKMLDKKFNLRLYSIVLDKKNSCKEIYRLKKNITSFNNIGEPEISQDNLKELNYIFKELRLDASFKEKELKTEFKDYLNRQKFLSSINNSQQILNESQENEKLSTVEVVNKTSTFMQEDNSRILYMNSYEKEFGDVIYIIEIRSVDIETIDLFYKYPDLSFLRMVLDYYFIDYFIENQNDMLNMSGNNTNKKYNEDSVHFNRRITRLYFGKIQEILLKKSEIKEIIPVFDVELNNQYYFYDMLEKIDDISNLTYEGSNPFGSILFLNREVLSSDNNPIVYTIKFQDNLIALNDAKLIRKLLELTNNEKDLYLISDHETIYGLGKINWSQIDDYILLRVDFKGVSKYNINLITTKENGSSNGDIAVKNGRKTCQINRDLEIIDKNLLKVSFKSPLIGGDGFTSEKFKRLLKDGKFHMDGDVIEYLEQVVLNAKEQKHGTMVVITDYETAVSELKTLKKQSIPIESKQKQIIPEYIEYLTSIDGAIYFDTNGKCHAIGVILDGIAKENIGDASRGARYNSAYRYLEKIKGLNKKCIIVIISEDGMVNLIPESDDEEKIFALLQQVVDLINENKDKEKIEIELNEIEEIINNDDNTDYQIFFKVAEVYRGMDNYEKAIKYYEKGMSVADGIIILVKNYRYWAKLHFDYARETKNKEQRIHNYEEAKIIFDEYLVKANENELNLHDYNDCALVYKFLGDNDTTEKLRTTFHQKAHLNYSKAIEVSDSKDIGNASLFFNRSNVRKEMGMFKESLEDLITAEFIKSSEVYINSFMDLIQSNNEWIDYCIQIINKKRDNDLKGENLIKKLREYGDSIREQSPEIAASFENL
ncbi:hypothetical protein B1B04_18800 [Lysinibacillus sp. KCTC 33748]|nr:hypothetical protein B1B04_18800 [Lysinibacillus sp. KCTC 33748]SKC04740.1 hypothetical protein SAMN06295926_11948 [Lysinibacillus sp. AC-3]